MTSHTGRIEQTLKKGEPGNFAEAIERIKQITGVRHDYEVAEILDISTDSLSHYKNGDRIHINVDRFCSNNGVNEHWLKTGKDWTFEPWEPERAIQIVREFIDKKPALVTVVRYPERKRIPVADPGYGFVFGFEEYSLSVKMPSLYYSHRGDFPVAPYYKCLDELVREGVEACLLDLNDKTELTSLDLRSATVNLRPVKAFLLDELARVRREWHRFNKNNAAALEIGWKVLNLGISPKTVDKLGDFLSQLMKDPCVLKMISGVIDRASGETGGAEGRSQ